MQEIKMLHEQFESTSEKLDTLIEQARNLMLEIGRFKRDWCALTVNHEYDSEDNWGYCLHCNKPNPLEPLDHEPVDE